MAKIVKLIKENLLTKSKIEIADLSTASESLRVSNLNIANLFCDQFHIVYLSYSYPPIDFFNLNVETKVM
jgi:hypothetical protein